LKAFFTTAPLLIHVDLSKPFVLEMDTFDFALGVVLSQLEEDNLLHPIGFHFVSFLLPRLTMRFMTKNSWPLWMLLKNDIIYLKEFNMKSLCTLTTRISNIS
jgi:hypothetical protein